MPNWFNRKLTLPNVKHSVNDLSNDFKTSFNIGQLIPVYLEDMLPSDKIIEHRSDFMIRMAPMFYALMHRIKVHSSNFFVPYRIIMGDDLYQKWLNNERDIPKGIFTFDSIPGKTFRASNPFVNSIFDFLGIPPDSAVGDLDPEEETPEKWTLTINNPLPVLSYLCIVRDWYCDSNIQHQRILMIDNIIDYFRQQMDAAANFVISDSTEPFFGDSLDVFIVSYTKDYFNTARPQPELGTEMYVLNRPLSLTTNSSSPSSFAYMAIPAGTTSTSSKAVITDPQALNLSESTTIKDLWRKEMLQQYYQIDNKFGNRIREKLAGHFGVEISDKRIQIPRYCGGTSSSMQISEVIQTSYSSDSPLGFPAGRGSNYTRGKNRSFFIEEHGYYMTLLSLIPDNGYCNGMDRTFMKSNIFDFASPEFNNIGWQSIYKAELFASGVQAVDKQEWGYQPRYSEYRSHPSRCAGAFRRDEYLRWHLNRNFDDLPPLNENFLKVADTDRIFNYGDDSQLINTESCFVDCYTTSIVSRPISKEPDSIHIY